MFLLDTNICIFAIKQKKQKLLEKIQKEFKNGIYISSLTVAELEYGVSNSNYPDRNRLALMEFLSIFDFLYYDENDAISYGQIKTDLKNRGFLMGPIDLLLASQAVSKNLIMVTNNKKEFIRIKDLKVENWFI